MWENDNKFHLDKIELEKNEKNLKATILRISHFNSKNPWFASVVVKYYRNSYTSSIVALFFYSFFLSYARFNLDQRMCYVSHLLQTDTSFQAIRFWHIQLISAFTLRSSFLFFCLLLKFLFNNLVNVPYWWRYLREKEIWMNLNFYDFY